MKLYVAIITILTLNMPAVGQGFPFFPPGDSIYFEQIKNDTIQLRTATNQLGTRLAAKARVRLGYLKFIKGDLSGAVNDLKFTQQLPDGYPENGEGGYFMGRIKLQEKDTAQAEMLLKKYLLRHKNGVWSDGAAYHLLKIKASRGDVQFDTEAKKYLVERAGTHYAKDVHYQLMKYYRENKQWGKTLVEARKIIQLYPESNYAKDLKYQIGDFLLRLGRRDEAKEYYLQTANEAPANTEPGAIGRYLYAELLLGDTNYIEGRKQLRLVTELNPNITNWRILSQYSLAVSYLEEGTKKEDTLKVRIGTRRLKNFIEHYPTDKRVPRALRHLARTAEKKGALNECLVYIDQILRFDTTTVSNIALENRDKDIREIIGLQKESRIFLLDIYLYKMYRYKEAIEVCKILLQDDPLNPMLRLHLCRALAVSGERAASRVELLLLKGEGGEYGLIAEDMLKEMGFEEP